MRPVQRYNANPAAGQSVPRWVWTVLLLSLPLLLLQSLYLWQRSQAVQTLQAQLLGQALLPSAGQRSQVADPQLNRAYAELLEVSAQLTLPVQAWMICLRPPLQAPVRVTGFDWTTSSNAVDMRLSVNNREEFSRYLEALQEQAQGCAASLGQEERQPDGTGYQLSLKLRALAPGVDDAE